MPITDLENIPMFYLMGPVLGGDNWQTLACHKLLEQVGGQEFAIIVPNRWSENHILKRYFLRDHSVSTSQTSWERNGLYLTGRGARSGCIICWLPEESKKIPGSMEIRTPEILEEKLPNGAQILIGMKMYVL